MLTPVTLGISIHTTIDRQGIRVVGVLLSIHQYRHAQSLVFYLGKGTRQHLRRFQNDSQLHLVVSLGLLQMNYLSTSYT